MGYTHYWKPQREFTPAEWTRITEVAKAMHAISGVPLAREYDEPKSLPILGTDGEIRLNGIGRDGHETFLILRKPDGGFAFCKTAHKPYDVMVTGVLAAIADIAPGALKISSDGTEEEWGDGLPLARAATEGEIAWPCVENLW
ncbi:MAG: hypothetical protein E6Q97_03615 [Desulfurellales bacterium]|nr:MAG: hypothetical protein E6Q97_03615 [Desulfurellales bacterium]